MAVIYLGIAFAIIFAAGKLYACKRLENAGLPLSFRFAEKIITYLITLVCMAGMGMALYLESYSGRVQEIISLIIGSLIGAVLAFMVVTMLMQKTPRIFTKKTFKSFGIFLIIGALFISFTVFDITGYANRVPSPGQVKTAEITFSAYPFKYPYSNLYGYQLRNDMTVQAETDEDIQALTSFHREMSGHEKAFRTGSKSGADISSWRGYASFVYDLHGPFKMYRSYYLHSNYSTKELRKTLADMSCFREGMTLERLIGYEYIAGFAVEYSKGSKGSLRDLRLTDSEVLALAKCLDNDFRRLSASELTEKSPDFLLEFIIDVKYPKSGKSQGYDSYEIDYAVTSSYTETLTWLDEHPGVELLNTNSSIAV
jgi:hypothetical protein